MSDIIDAEVVSDETDVESSALVRQPRRSEVIRPLNADDLVESFRAYQELLPRLLDDTDYQSDGQTRFVKKSGWRKIAAAFDLDVYLIRSTVERDMDGRPVRAEAVARAVAPSGRTMDGDGYCSVDEPRFAYAKGRMKLENDLRSTAATRAKNRAIADLVGKGAVSAEEVSAAVPQVDVATIEDIDKFRGAMRYLLDDAAWSDPHIERTLAAITKLGGGDIPKVAVQAIGVAAREVKAAREAQATAVASEQEEKIKLVERELDAEEVTDAREAGEADIQDIPF